jgi:hypothetical protein
MAELHTCPSTTKALAHSPGSCRAVSCVHVSACRLSSSLEKGGATRTMALQAWHQHAIAMSRRREVCKLLWKTHKWRCLLRHWMAWRNEVASILAHTNMAHFMSSQHDRKVVRVALMAWFERLGVCEGRIQQLARQRLSRMLKCWHHMVRTSMSARCVRR